MKLKGITIYPKTRTSKGYNGSRDPYYQSKEWKHLRALKFQLNPICEDCLEQGRITETHTIDHIIPRKQGGPDHINNLRSRCKRHNAIKTALDNSNNHTH